MFGDDYDTPDGSCIRDYIHVVDLASAHVRSLEWLAGRSDATLNEHFNIGTGRGHSVLEAIAAFQRGSGRSLPYRLGHRREGDIEKTYANVDKAERMLRWRAKHDIDAAMRDAWHWQQLLAGSS